MCLHCRCRLAIDWLLFIRFLRNKVGNWFSLSKNSTSREGRIRRSRDLRITGKYYIPSPVTSHHKGGNKIISRLPSQSILQMTIISLIHLDSAWLSDAGLETTCYWNPAFFAKWKQIASMRRFDITSPTLVRIVRTLATNKVEWHFDGTVSESWSMQQCVHPSSSAYYCIKSKSKDRT